jgi:phosphoglycerate dehydrogenase-like enzyme
MFASASPLRESLDAAGDLVLVQELTDWTSLRITFGSADEKVIAIDPRFCNWQVPNDVLDSMRNTVAVCLQTTSFSWVDVAHARVNGIAVTNNRDFSTVAVAEWATMMVLLAARRVPLLTAAGGLPQFKEGFEGIELRGRKAGIIGLGRIGTTLAENMAGLGMKVQYWSQASVDPRYQKVTLEHLMSTSDVILPALAKNDDTKRLITDALLQSMGKTTIFVSVDHDIYNHNLVLELAGRGKIFGYAFEQNGAAAPVGNVWVGPQMAWFTHESVDRNTQYWATAIVSATHRQFPNLVN